MLRQLKYLYFYIQYSKICYNQALLITLRKSSMNSSVLVKFIVGMIVMMNPLGSLSIFVNLTRHYTDEHMQKTALTCGVSILIIMWIVVWFGEPILGLLGVSIASFRFAGGVILLLMGLSMLQSQESPIKYTSEEKYDAEKRESIATVPLAVPIIIGPGAISTIIAENNNYAGFNHKIILSLVCLVLAAGMTLLLYYANPVCKAVGNSVIRVVTRIMGMIVTAMAASLLAQGVVGLIPALGH